MKPKTQCAESQQTLVLDPSTSRGLRNLVEPLAGVIAASDDPVLAWAVVINEMHAQVMSINTAAQVFLTGVKATS